MTAGPFLLFQFHDRRGRPQSLRFAEPVEVIVARCVEDVRPALRAVQRGVRAGLYAGGYVSYEAAPAFDPAFRVCAGTRIPLLWFGLFREPVAAPPDHVDGPFQVAGWQPTISRDGYDRDIADVRAAIGRGDTYQVNYTMRLRTQFAGDDFAFYRRLYRAQHAAYCAYLNIGRYRLLSASPELFFRWYGDRIIARPMMGTVRRGRWPEEDDANAAWLAASEKNRAENLMIVDLLRNDLGRVASIGSVHVPSLFAIEPYRTVFQMTSTVAATVRPAATLEDVFTALFPCGSITGTPKVSTMSLIAALEDFPREAYCGTIGFVTPGGEATFNVAIRTVLLDTQTGCAEYGVGGGITWDSTADDEYAEALNKAELLAEEWPAFELLETIRLENGEYTLLERHMQCLRASARYFDVPLSVEAAWAALEAHGDQAQRPDLSRLRWRSDPGYRSDRAGCRITLTAVIPPQRSYYPGERCPSMACFLLRVDGRRITTTIKPAVLNRAICAMQFEWDEARNEANIRRHRIDFADVRGMFLSPMLTDLDDRMEYGEDRWISIGMLTRGIAVVVWTERDGDVIRIISARKANKDERRRYEAYLTH